MILLDTNAVLWLFAGHVRAAALRATTDHLFLSPVTLLELKLLLEVGRLPLAAGHSLADVMADPRWQLDSPGSDTLFNAALDMAWTRDPFDRLIVAHARCRRWRLATGDRHIQANMPASSVLAL